MRYSDQEIVISEAERVLLRFEEVEKLDESREFKRLRILQTQDGGQSWNEMPLQLSLCSRLLLFFAAHPYWPPGDVLRAGCDGPPIWFEYRDDPDGTPFFFNPSVWSETYGHH